ncbi:hypothetical protein PI95_029320 [Hassallia byssoidea VB512170]|uniref:Uncharacterized protein n=1 Tax=Hassallia byssoidea VB512170 TaxID=1304833 RepID=A0A846HGP2_9CYAN|nr:hypothetical protein [Hassalia byssoidea]NEU76505.1 hypothetical protein [Hassalia byssoidea VB512170]
MHYPKYECRDARVSRLYIFSKDTRLVILGDRLSKLLVGRCDSLRDRKAERYIGD